MSLFKTMALHESIQQALVDMKFTEPTKIQTATIPLGLEKKDIIACAETGSGKTVAFGIPIVQMLIEDHTKNALILTPTRELAQQIADVMRTLTVHAKHLNLALLVGGADMRKQLNTLQKKPRIVIATPGRLTDHLRRKSVSLSQTGILVLDEGDRMIDMGFAPQLDVILKFLPSKRQTLFFTATITDKVRKLAEKYLNKPESVSIGKTSQPVATVKQSVIQTNGKDKDDKLVDELNKRKGSIIIFARTKRRTDALRKYLFEYGFQVSLIHGGRTQGQRNQAIAGFKEGKFRILCATDVAARGIDIPSIEHVINYDLPMMDEDYVHRIGRTGRNGAKGEAVSFVAPQDHKTWKLIAKKYNIKDVELTGSGDDSRGDSRRFSKKKTFSRGGGSGGGGGFKKRSSRPSSRSGSSPRAGGSRPQPRG